MDINDYYGPYDCVPNAIVYFLKKYDLSPNPLYLYNWDIEYNPEYNRLHGCIYNGHIHQLLNDVYHIDVESIKFGDLSTCPDTFHIILNMHDLPYSKFYGNAHHDHCVVGRMLTPESVEIIDPYYNATHILSLEECYNSWKKYHDIIYVLRYNHSPLLRVDIRPYIVDVDYQQKYTDALKFIDKVSDMYRMDPPERQAAFDRYFGMLYSALISRTRYFEALPEPSNYQKPILSKWIEIQKKYVAFRDFSQPMRTLFELEIEYLEVIK